MRSMHLVFSFLFTMFALPAVAQDLEGLNARIPSELTSENPYPAVEWMMPVLSTLGSQGLGNNIGTYHRVENPAGETFSQICNYIGSGIASSSETFYISLVDGATGLPTDKLWTGSTISTASSGQKCDSFTAGTFTTLGATYQDTNGNLALPYGTTIFKHRVKSHLNNERYISTPRQLGIDPADILTTTWNGLTISFAGDDVDGVELYDGRIPYMPLVLTAPAQ